MKMGNTSLKMRSRNRNTWNKKPLVAAFPLFLGMASGMFAQTHGPDDGYVPFAAQQGCFRNCIVPAGLSLVRSVRREK